MDTASLLAKWQNASNGLSTRCTSVTDRQTDHAT